MVAPRRSKHISFSKVQKYREFHKSDPASESDNFNSWAMPPPHTTARRGGREGGKKQQNGDDQCLQFKIENWKETSCFPYSLYRGEKKQAKITNYTKKVCALPMTKMTSRRFNINGCHSNGIT
jgi:hypothetical protein